MLGVLDRAQLARVAGGSVLCDPRSTDDATIKNTMDDTTVARSMTGSMKC